MVPALVPFFALSCKNKRNIIPWSHDESVQYENRLPFRWTWGKGLTHQLAPSCGS